MKAANDDETLDQPSNEVKRIITPNHVSLAFSLASDVIFLGSAVLVLATDHRFIGVGCFLLSRWLAKGSAWMKGSLDTYRQMEKELENVNLNGQINESSERLREVTQRANSVLLRSKFTYPWRL